MRQVVMIALFTGLFTLSFGCDDGGNGPAGDAAADSEAAPLECEDDEDCDDGIECTSEYCESGRCRRDADDLLCSDGNECNGIETCEIGEGCQAGEAIVCDDRINCTVDECNPETGRCVSEPDDDLCPSGHVCDPSLDGCVPE